MKLKTLLLACACLAASSISQSQTPAKPASAASTRTLGGGSGSGPILTRDELRQCLAQTATLREEFADADKQRAVLDKEKQGLAADQKALLEARAPIDAMKQKVSDLNARMTAYGEKVKAWNARVADFNDNRPSGSRGDKIGDQLKQDQEALQAEQKQLEAEKAALASTGKPDLEAYNAKATALQAKVADWNQRNDQFSAKAKDLEDQRSAWTDNCSNRRYREDDETAIKKGK